MAPSGSQVKKVIGLCLPLLTSLACSKRIEPEALAAVGSASTVLEGQPNQDALEMEAGWSDKKDEGAAVREAVDRMNSASPSKRAPKLAIVLSSGTKYDEQAVHAALKTALDPSTKLWGMTVTERGLLTPAGRHLGVSLMGIYASEMKVGVGQVALPDWQAYDHYQDVGKEVITAALKDAGQGAGGPKPKFVLFAGLNLVTDTKILRGIESVIGADVPIIGGNAAEGTWDMAGGKGYTNEGVKGSVITVAAVWADRKIGVAYGYGYKKTEHQGIVTKSDVEKRIVYEIDRRPAVDVYNEWVGGTLSELTKKGGPIPFEVFSQYPISKPISDKPDDYVLIAPLRFNPDKSIFVTHEGVEQGKELTVYKLDNEDVVVKPAVVATLAMAQGGVSPADLAGSFMLYCDAPFAGANASPDGIVGPYYHRAHQPFIGFFATGEMGYSTRGGNRTLSYSTVSLVFGKTRVK
jgi:hypothetical protein